eukprot:GHUV01038986.1.p1 GENE.GHUV01038986.1~~GHUV01038986.1.p1  ORF type:complete len:112 (+),score=8.09 GHUV01038986.1:200-535(+)
MCPSALGGRFFTPLGSCHVCWSSRSQLCSPKTPTKPPSTVHTDTLLSLLPLTMSGGTIVGLFGSFAALVVLPDVLYPDTGRLGMMLTLVMAPSWASQWARCGMAGGKTCPH